MRSIVKESARSMAGYIVLLGRSFGLRTLGRLLVVCGGAVVLVYVLRRAGAPDRTVQRIAPAAVLVAFGLLVLAAPHPEGPSYAGIWHECDGSLLRTSGRETNLSTYLEVPGPS